MPLQIRSAQQLRTRTLCSSGMRQPSGNITILLLGSSSGIISDTISHNISDSISNKWASGSQSTTIKAFHLRELNICLDTGNFSAAILFIFTSIVALKPFAWAWGSLHVPGAWWGVVTGRDCWNWLLVWKARTRRPVKFRLIRGCCLGGERQLVMSIGRSIKGLKCSRTLPLRTPSGKNILNTLSISFHPDHTNNLAAHPQALLPFHHSLYS